MRRPQNLVEFLAMYPTGAARPEQDDPTPRWAYNQPRPSPTRGPFMPLPRQSELPARRAMLEQVAREQRARELPAPMAAPMVTGPGGVTGDEPPAPMRFRQAMAPPDPLPFIAPQMQPMRRPVSRIIQRERMPAEPDAGVSHNPTTGRPLKAPESADYEVAAFTDLDEAWNAARARARARAQR